MKECNQCGKCCIHYGGGDLAATEEEIQGWELFNPEIFDYVDDGNIWVDPASGKQLTRCPWLEELPAATDTAPARYACRIYHDRPQDCRHYPTSLAEMIRDECEMIEVQDLESPGQAQTTLDRLMADSRPPLG